MTGVLLDVDVILKICAYRLCEEALSGSTTAGVPPAVLSIARFTIRSRLAGNGRLADPRAARAAWEAMAGRLRRIDPTADEIEAAAGFEERAAVLGLEFDSGESQLLAVLLRRGERLLVTGDKRAVAAVGRVCDGAAGRIACLEQLVASIVANGDHAAARLRVCSEPGADASLTACFACSSQAASAADVAEGLRSHVAHLRRRSGNVLAAGDLLPVVP